jgi:hypothetical protein
MTQSSKPNRTYNSSRRRLQAAQTRRLIIESARKLFYERGYASATIEAIVFGNKQAILRNLVGITLVGDDEPVPLLERPFIKEAGLETDQRNLINKFAKDIYQIMSRMSPIFSLLRTTAKTDAEIAALLTRLLNERLGGMSFFVDQLNRIGPLREQALPDQARASVWALSSAEVFDLLTRDLGWSEERYIRWLSDSLVQLLLP